MREYKYFLAAIDSKNVDSCIVYAPIVSWEITKELIEDEKWDVVIKQLKELFKICETQLTKEENERSLPK